MSQFGWQVLALQSAQQAGISTPPERQRLMSKFLLSCNTGLKRGLASYRPGFGATAAMTAESMACRGWLDVQNKPEQLTEGTQYLLKRLPSTEQFLLLVLWKFVIASRWWGALGAVGGRFDADLTANAAERWKLVGYD
jgi:hypothetical protein